MTIDVSDTEAKASMPLVKQNVHGSRKVRERIRKTVTLILLSLIGIAFLYPFLWMIGTSFKENIEVYSNTTSILPQTWRFENYKDAFTYVPFARFYLNTIIMTMGRVAGQLLLASIAAYAFARLEFPGKDTLFLAVLAVMMIPSVVLFIPRYILVLRLNWTDSFLGLIVPGLADAYGVFLLRQFFMTLPRDFIDAAKIDGCNPLQTFYKIALPLTQSALVAYGFMVTMWTWNDFLWPLIVVNHTPMFTIALGIRLFVSQYSKNISVMMAAAAIAVIPIMVLFVVVQNFIIEGITMSGLKG